MRKKSKYKPKGVRLDNLSWIKAGFAKVGTLPKAGVALKLKNHECLDSVLKGEANKDHINVLIAALNMAEACYKINPELGIDYADEIRAAQDAVYTMSKRSFKTNKFLFTGPEMSAVKLAMEIHDAQLDQCTVKEMEQSLNLVETNIKTGKTRKIEETA